MTIHRYGKVRGYLINAQLWVSMTSILAMISPRWRRRLPALAKRLTQDSENSSGAGSKNQQ